jgi:membrane-bound lytic murein transglycosylase D
MEAYQKLTFKYLDKYGLPRWLATVPIVESSYNHKATSTMGALGLWQLMPFNIKRYKTRRIKVLGREIKIVPTEKQIKWYGYNPVLSTQLATKHLAMLYSKYRDYENTEELALMAYNAGETTVNRWLAGKKKLPDETANYYRKLMAIQYIMKHSARLNIKPIKQRKILFHHHILALTKYEADLDRKSLRELFKQMLG